ncbi:MAG TPA: phosphate ABC transporter permease PstA [Allosphingosinicella sp.]|nr:phosphate ABC transporter permease PstA [Allosphingosinicella sp.]
MSEAFDKVDPTPTDWKAEAMQRRIRKRYGAERRFKLVGLMAVLMSAGFLAFLMWTMVGNGARGFMQTQIRLDLPAEQVSLLDAGAWEDAVRVGGGDAIFSGIAWRTLRDRGARGGPIWLPAADAIDVAAKGEGTAEAERAYAALAARDRVRTGINWTFLTGSDATDPTVVGIWGAFKGSLLTMIVTLALAFPIGVLSAVYLEEYAPRNRWTDMIEVTINNLAAVPSIIFGLLGLAIFLNFMHLPRSAPIVGGLTLALMTMPVIVIAGRNAIKSVPPSIRDAALGIGASRIQVVSHHVLPLALPGILTGTIIGMARALGETAPLLMIGMRAFIASPPAGVSEPATVLPVQIFLWSDEVSRGFVEKTSAAIIVLLVFLLAMNGIAIYLRNRFEKRW